MNDNDTPTPDNVRPLFPKGVPQEGYREPQPEEPKMKQDNYTVTVWKEGEDGSLSPFEYNLTGHLVITGTNIVLIDENGELKWACPNNDALISIERIDV